MKVCLRLSQVKINHVLIGTQYLGWGARSRWVVGQTYRIVPLNYSIENVTFSLSNAPPGLFLDISTGAMLYNPISVLSMRVVQLTATHPQYDGFVVIANISIEVRGVTSLLSSMAQYSTNIPLGA